MNTKDYSGVTVHDAIFGITLIGRFSSAVDEQASMENFRDMVTRAVEEKFPGVKVVITLIPKLHGSAATIAMAEKSESKQELVDEVGEGYMNIMFNTLIAMEWVVTVSGEQLSPRDKLLIALSPAIGKSINDINSGKSQRTHNSIEELLGMSGFKAETEVEFMMDFIRHFKTRH